jgi:CheY-like chemotaxis protein
MTKILRDILDNLFKDVLIIKTLREGSEAIKLINSPELKVRPDLIFTDIVMEQTSGMEVIKAARNQDPPILTIAITSLQREMKDILDAGANYLHKNWITRDTIGEVMRDLVERTICGEVGVIGGETYVKPTST